MKHVMKRLLRFVLISIAIVGISLAVRADEKAAEDAKAGPVSFYRDVRPILQNHCQGCHQPAKAGADLIVTGYAELIAGGDSQEDVPIVAPGKPDESLLIEEITPDEKGKASMPKKKDALPVAQIEILRRWIAEGAKDDTPASAGRPRYSSENPPVYRELPVLTSLDFSPDGKVLAVSGYNEVLLHKADGTGLVARLVGVSERIERASFSPDGKLLAVTGGSPAERGEVQIWDVENRKLKVSVPVTYDTVYGVSWSDDGKLIAFGCADNSVRVIDASKGEEVLFNGAHSDWVLGTTFSKDASHLITVSRDQSMKLIKVETQQFIDNITSITPGALKGGLMDVQRHPKEDQVLTVGADGVPKIYRIYREKARKIGDDYNLIRKFEKLPGRIFDAEFNADGSQFVVGSSLARKGEVRVCSSGDGKTLWAVPLKSAVYAVAFSADGKTVACGGFDGRVRILSVAEGKVIKEFLPVPIALSL